ncbi:MAG: hypothetical protein ABSG15_08825 [FCB group bacterium]|jgi:hypothetical protein
MAERIPISKIQVGQVLQDSVQNKFGQTIIPAGTAIQEKHKRILKTWNIQTVRIVTDDNKSDEPQKQIEINDEKLKLAAKKIKTRMKWNPRNKNEVDLYELALLNAASYLINESGFSDSDFKF